MKLKLVKRLSSFLIPTMAALSLSLGVVGCSSSEEDGEIPDAEMSEGYNAEANNNASLNNNALGNDAAMYGTEIAENPAGTELQNLVSEGGSDAAGEAPIDGVNAGVDPFAANADPLAYQNPAPNAPPENAFNGTEQGNTEDEEYVEEEYVEEEVVDGGEGGAASMPGAVPEIGTKVAYYVSTGDTLGSIAQKIFGSKAKWKELAQDNSISNPNRIFAGDVIYYSVTEQSKAFAESYEGAARKTVTVAAGDTLSGISAKIYGSQGEWRKLWKENGHIKNPDIIKIGSVLTYRVTNATAKLEDFEQNEDQVVTDASEEAELNQDAASDMVVIRE